MDAREELLFRIPSRSRSRLKLHKRGYPSDHIVPRRIIQPHLTVIHDGKFRLKQLPKHRLILHQTQSIRIEPTTAPTRKSGNSGGNSENNSEAIGFFTHTGIPPPRFPHYSKRSV